MKKYNAFKMWGSYVGALIAFYLVNTLECFGHCPSLLRELFYIGDDLLAEGLAVIIGFILGWVAHSLFRKIYRIYRKSD